MHGAILAILLLVLLVIAILIVRWAYYGTDDEVIIVEEPDYYQAPGVVYVEEPFAYQSPGLFGAVVAAEVLEDVIEETFYEEPVYVETDYDDQN